MCVAYDLETSWKPVLIVAINGKQTRKPLVLSSAKCINLSSLIIDFLISFYWQCFRIPDLFITTCIQNLVSVL